MSAWDLRPRRLNSPAVEASVAEVEASVAEASVEAVGASVEVVEEARLVAAEEAPPVAAVAEHHRPPIRASEVGLPAPEVRFRGSVKTS